MPVLAYGGTAAGIGRHNLFFMFYFPIQCLLLNF